MDMDISRWLLDFLVRQPIHDSTLTTLLAICPLDDTHHSNLKKLLLLRKIESHISNSASIPDDVLYLLEQIEELDFRNNVQTSESIKRAYCAVAVHSTLGLLKDDDDDDIIMGGEYFEAVEKIWRFRVGSMEKFGNVGLLSDELISWKDDIEIALCDCNVRKGLLDKWKKGGVFYVVEAVRVFVEDTKEEMGPSFLELAAATLSQDDVDDDTLKQLFGVEDTEQEEEGVGFCALRDIQKGTVQRRSKVRASKQYKKLNSRTSRGVKIVDNDELSDASPHNNYGCLSAPEAKLQVNLRASTSELQEMVKDPLPEALEMTKNVASNMDSVDNRTDAIHTEKINLGNKASTHQDNATKASLMERNNSASTYEWDESSDGSADLRSRPHLSILNKRLVSPLKKDENPKPRRKRKFWSNLEADTLRTGVKKYGVGNWKLILNMYRDIFDERTEVDLKDKWRNLTT